MSAHDEDAPTWRRGIVTELKASAAMVKVKFPDEDGMVSDWLPVLLPFTLGGRAYWLPRVNSQVVVLLDEHGEDGVVMGGIYSSADPAPSCNADAFHVELEDGTAITLTAGKIIATTPGDIEATAGGNLTANVSGNASATIGGSLDVQVSGSATLKAASITLDGPVTCTKTLTVTGPAALNGGMTVAPGAGGKGAVISGGAQISGGSTLDTATIGSKDFASHTHQAQGSTAVTTPPL